MARDAVNVTAQFANFETHRRNIELGFAAVFIMLSLTLLILRNSRRWVHYQGDAR